jgi:hypothetical protein
MKLPKSQNKIEELRNFQIDTYKEFMSKLMDEFVTFYTANPIMEAGFLKEPEGHKEEFIRLNKKWIDFCNVHRGKKSVLQQPQTDTFYKCVDEYTSQCKKETWFAYMKTTLDNGSIPYDNEQLKKAYPHTEQEVICLFTIKSLQDEGIIEANNLLLFNYLKNTDKKHCDTTKQKLSVLLKSNTNIIDRLILRLLFWVLGKNKVLFIFNKTQIGLKIKGKEHFI